jgi:hypothetical protein
MRTYSLAEVAAQILPPDCDGERWLSIRLNRGEIRGYRVCRVWRMTEDHVTDLVDRYSNQPESFSEPASVVDGLSQRSRRRLRSAS